MNKHTAKDYLPLVQALADGKVIQFKGSPDHPWVDLFDGAEFFIYTPENYRIKPEPREVWANVYEPPLHSRDYVFHESKEVAVMAAGIGARQVLFREVLE